MAQPVVEALKVALADTFTFYLKAQDAKPEDKP